METNYLSRVLMRLRPFVRDGVIRRTRLERVLRALEIPPDAIRPEVERLLAKAKIRIDEDQVRALPAAAPIAPEQPRNGEPEENREDGPPVPEAGPSEPLDWSERQLAVKAARSRITADRCIANHAAILLTAQQEVGLALLIRGREGRPLEQGELASLTGEARAAAECLFLHNQRLVHSIAKRYPQTGMSYDDLVQHGMTGLVRAVELFDPARGNKFSTYATWWIRQSITRGLANEARLIRLPVHMVDRLNKVWGVRTRLMVGGVPPSIYQLARACELQEEQVLECLRLGPPDLPSLDMKIGDGEATLADVLDTADPELDPAHLVEHLLLQEELSVVLDTLSDREAGVIAMRFGLTTGEQMTLEEIGKVYGVTRERIRQIQSKALDKLKHRSRSQVLEPFFYGGGKRPRPKGKPADGGAAEAEGGGEPEPKGTFRSSV
ncbi:sigma-70 family RNA polymerase sigma factor [Mumia sp. zg.B53]|uniref:sigma-70 family RNA polymerase sigma factor n=1 Tax=Mumia sp. zg.B53 TaxID=2855449 RepID=UPI001C6E3414|nr:sigma-70 family RNA polymerase sigma factor [Mumia sp. zg.B53]MBW9213229.1 sigma-70 family RNA polymerase sigma factor [Mumia sp. zg.B53]